MKKFLFLILTLAFIQASLLKAYEPKLLWTKLLGGEPGSAVISNDDKFIYAANGTRIYKLDLDSGTIIKSWEVGSHANIIRISNDDKTLYLGCNKGLRFFDLMNEKI